MHQYPGLCPDLSRVRGWCTSSVECLCASVSRPVSRLIQSERMVHLQFGMFVCTSIQACVQTYPESEDGAPPVWNVCVHQYPGLCPDLSRVRGWCTYSLECLCAPVSRPVSRLIQSERMVHLQCGMFVCISTQACVQTYPE